MKDDAQPKRGGTQETEPDDASQETPLRQRLTRQQLAQTFPRVFGPGACKPLTIRITNDIHEHLGRQHKVGRIANIVNRIAGSRSHLEAPAQGGPRFELDGNEYGTVSEKHQQAVKDQLERNRQEPQAYAERAKRLKAVEASGMKPNQYRIDKGLEFDSDFADGRELAKTATRQAKGHCSAVPAKRAEC